MATIYSVQQIKFEIFAYVKEFGADFSDWYVGISHDPKKALFEDHELDEQNDIWLYKQAMSFAACETVQKYFLETQNTEGNKLVAASEDTDCVYAYKKSENTKP